MSNSHPIGFFDSGVGGLSVYSEFKKVLPYENTIYFGDLLHLPYGNKSKEDLINYARMILDYFSTKHVKAVVIACNTSSAQAYDVIKNEYSFPIFPIIQSCAKTIAGYNCKKIGVFATDATVKSQIYSREILKHNPDVTILEIACPNWVGIVEGSVENIQDDIKNPMQNMLNFNPDKIILGCTHYPYLINKLTEYFPKEVFINPASIFVNQIKINLNRLNMLKTEASDAKDEFYVSANPQHFFDKSKIFYSVKELPNLVDLDATILRI